MHITSSKGLFSKRARQMNSIFLRKSQEERTVAERENYKLRCRITCLFLTKLRARFLLISIGVRTLPLLNISFLPPLNVRYPTKTTIFAIHRIFNAYLGGKQHFDEAKKDKIRQTVSQNGPCLGIQFILQEAPGWCTFSKGRYDNLRWI